MAVKIIPREPMHIPFGNIQCGNAFMFPDDDSPDKDAVYLKANFTEAWLLTEGGCCRRFDKNCIIIPVNIENIEVSYLF